MNIYLGNKLDDKEVKNITCMNPVCLVKFSCNEVNQYLSSENRVRYQRLYLLATDVDLTECPD
jgi:hypothetical protein